MQMDTGRKIFGSNVSENEIPKSKPSSTIVSGALQAEEMALNSTIDLSRNETPRNETPIPPKRIEIPLVLTPRRNKLSRSGKFHRPRVASQLLGNHRSFHLVT